MSEEMLHTPKNPLTIGVTRPVSVWNRPLEVDFYKLFGTLTVGIIDVATAQWGAAANDLFDSIDTVKLKDDPGQLLWLLIVTAMQRALVEVTDEYLPDLDLAPEEDPGAFVKPFAEAIEKANCTLDTSFMEHPGQLDLLKPVADAYQHWLHGLGMGKTESQTIAARLRPHFVFSLHKTWRDNPNRYAPILRELDTPFAQASQEEHSWLKYYAYLDYDTNKSIFGEVFGLEQIFIPLHAYHVEIKQPRQHALQSQKREETEIRHVVRLEECIDHWLDTSGKDDAIRMISGGPGAGKSSFCRMYAANVARRGRRVLLIPLHQRSPDGNLLDDVRRFAREGLEVQGKIFSSEGPPTLVIFDGLDEVSMHGDVGESVARAFCEKASAMVTELNTSYHKVHLLISGRVLAVQAGENRIQGKTYTLQILPYKMLSDRYSFNGRSIQYKDPNGLLKRDLRDEWWEKLSECTDEGFSSMPEELNRKDLHPITVEPLLNYLLARLYRKQEIELSNDIPLNKIYALLLHDIYERNYEKKHSLICKSEFSKNEFISTLEDVALVLWQNDGQKITIEELKIFVNENALQQLATRKGENIKLLLETFFFQAEHEKSKQNVFAFTDKGFGEYLASCCLIRKIEEINEEFQSFQEGRKSGLLPSPCLNKEKWLASFGQQPITEGIGIFLREEIQLRATNGCFDAQSCQNALATLLNDTLTCGPKAQEVFPQASFRTLQERVRNTDITLLISLDACARVTQNNSSIDWPGENAFSCWFNGLSKPSKDNTWWPLRKNTSYLSLVEQILCSADLREVDLSNADLSQANLSEVNLRNADLSQANLKGANLQEAKLSGAKLSGAKLFEANLRGAELSKATLCKARLSKADLSCTNLERTDFTDANLENVSFASAKLINPLFKRAHIVGGDFRKAEIHGADFCEAALSNANMQSANLCGVNLSKTNLRGANLCETNLRGANLDEADLQEARLSNTNLHKASLYKANLRSVNLCSIDLSEAYMYKVKMPEAKLCEANLNGVNLRDAELVCVDLHNANLCNADLDSADLRKAELCNAKLCNANFCNASLDEADLRGADLRGAKFCEASFDCADLRDTNLTDVDFRDISCFGAIFSKSSRDQLEHMELDLSDVEFCG